MKKSKNPNLRDQLLAEGVVYLGYDSKGNLWEHGKIITKAAEPPIKPTAIDVVARPTPKVNLPPKPTDPPARKLPQTTGLMRAINANIEAQGGTPIATSSKETAEVTGLQRAILANIRQQKSKPKTNEHDN